MFRSLLMTSALLVTTAVGGTAFAQHEIITLEPDNVEKPAEDSHEGHDHDHAHDHADIPTDIDIDHVYTEAPDDHTMGEADAPVTMIIYASVTCGHCSDWFTHQWPDFKRDLIETGKVRVVFREFPTAPAGLAMTGFLIANCAADGKFFSSIEHQMETQASIFEKVQAGDGRQAYLDVAEQAGIEGEDGLQDCFLRTEHEDRLNRALDRARASNTRSVPAFFINGEAYKDDQSAAGLAKKIDSVINAAK